MARKPVDPAYHNARYGAAHRAERRKWRPIVAAGGCVCVRFGGLIHPSHEWELDHDDDGIGYRGPAHMVCNRRAGAETTNARRGVRPFAPGRQPDPERHARRVAMGCPPEFTGGPDDPRRDDRGVLCREWGQW